MHDPGAYLQPDATARFPRRALHRARPRPSAGRGRERGGRRHRR
ncbi:MAG: hypothetical protein RML45_00555 [Acetobacteraceae bacterium]|nr:hypothetical protein [Acetobacteraceae bacterium]